MWDCREEVAILMKRRSGVAKDRSHKRKKEADPEFEPPIS